MKTVLLTLLGLTLLPAPGAFAHGSDLCRLNTSCCDAPVRWAQRHDTRGTRIAITSADGDALLLLTDDVVAMQLSERTFHKIKRELRHGGDDAEDNPFAQAIKTAVMASVSSLLNHSAECPIRDLKDVDYRQGRLVFTSEDGGRVFDHVNVNDEDVMRTFSEDDARLFVREFRRAKSRTR